MRKIINKFTSVSLQSKLVLVYLFTMALILFLNIYMYVNINLMMNKLDEIYVENINLNELSQSLDLVQNDMNSYLNTKTTDAMDSYYKSCQDYTVRLDALAEVVSSDETVRLERNIKIMSEEYLNLTDHAIEAKRGRNVEKYRYYYDQSVSMYRYIKSGIESLNNMRFINNSSNYTAVSVSLGYLEIVNTVVFVVVVVINIILVIMVIRNMTRPLTTLAKTANEVASGNFDVEKVDVTTKDEVGVVSSAFNHMVVSIKDNIEQLKESMDNERALKEKELLMESHLKDAKLKYLQTQINPHFLFNTLNAGVQLAMMEGADRTYNYVQTVADFFRYNIKKNHDRVTLREELELVGNYIYILNVRFSGEINYETNIDENLLDTVVPSMILQPVVENSVNYGIRDIDWPGKINLSVYEKENRVYISIIDNGVGITEEKVKEIMDQELRSSMESNDEADSNGIGLDNVISRLNLFYGEDDLFEISSLGKNLGTKVLFKIPKHADGDFDEAGVTDNV